MTGAARREMHELASASAAPGPPQVRLDPPKGVLKSPPATCSSVLIISWSRSGVGRNRGVTEKTACDWVPVAHTDPEKFWGRVFAADFLIKSSFSVPAGRSTNTISVKSLHQKRIGTGFQSDPERGPQRTPKWTQNGPPKGCRSGPLSLGCLAPPVFSPLWSKNALAKRRKKPCRLEKSISVRKRLRKHFPNVGKSPTNWFSTFHQIHDFENPLF